MGTRIYAQYRVMRRVGGRKVSKWTRPAVPHTAPAKGRAGAPVEGAEGVQQGQLLLLKSYLHL